MGGHAGRLCAPSSGKIASTLMGEGDLSADVCVVDEEDEDRFNAVTLTGTPPIRRDGGVLAAQAADNLFWFGRYGERAEMTVRVIRSILGGGIEVDAGASGHPAVRARLVELLTSWGHWHRPVRLLPQSGCRAALAEDRLPGGVASLLNTQRNVGQSLRDRFAPDFWRIASRPLPPLESHRPGALLRVARELWSGLPRSPGLAPKIWCVVRRGASSTWGGALNAHSLCRVARQLAGAGEESDRLNTLLDIFDSQITYRSRYLSSPLRDPVYDLLLLDPDNPRSLVHQVLTIERHITALPTLREDALPEAPLRDVRAVLAPLISQTVDQFDEAKLGEIETRCSRWI
jgi:uncharacterized alpha-E superfamily protein